MEKSMLSWISQILPHWYARHKILAYKLKILFIFRRSLFLWNIQSDKVGRVGRKCQEVVKHTLPLSRTSEKLILSTSAF